jgi:hypothetical protein
VAKKKALSNSEVSKLNVKSFKTWLSKNAKKIKAMPGKSVVYSGGKYDVTVTIDEKSDEVIINNTKMWQAIKNINDHLKQQKLPTKYDTLEDVLSGMRSHPVFIDRDQNEKHFSHMFEYMRYLEKFPKLFPKGNIGKCWSELSRAYTANAQGDIAFFDGVTDDYKILKKDKILLNTELLSLLKNPDLSQKSKKELAQKVGKYLKTLNAEQKTEIKAILNERSDLLKKLKNAQNKKKA